MHIVVDPIGRDPCSAWATYDCLNYGEEVNEDYYGYSLTTFQVSVFAAPVELAFPSIVPGVRVSG